MRKGMRGGRMPLRRETGWTGRINWEHKEEEKFDYIKDGIKMGLDLLKLRLGR